MNILSLSFGHDGLAAVVVDGKLVAAIASERLTRYKKQRGVSRDTVNYVLQKAGLRWGQIDLVAVTNWFWECAPDGRELYDKRANDVALTFSDGRPLEMDAFRRFYTLGGMLLGNLVFRMGADSAPCVIVDHHAAHAAYAFYMSPYDDAIVFTLDGSDCAGANMALHFFDDKQKTCTRLRRTWSDVSELYGYACEYLGFYPHLVDAGKVMALAAYGKPLEAAERLARLTRNDPTDPAMGNLYMNLLIHAGVRKIPEIHMIYPPLKGEGGKPSPDWLNPKDWRSPMSTTIAATIQKMLEIASDDLLRATAAKCGNLSRNLCLAGGSMLNCVNNGKILESGLFENVFIAPAAGDDGVAIGAALDADNRPWRADPANPSMQLRPGPKKPHSALECFEGGRRYSRAEVEAAIARNRSALEGAGIKVQSPKPDALLDLVADHIVADRIIGWFYRGSELGPRALGHRSILANPRNKDMKDILNSRVKHREEFRPFAPAVLAEHAHEWFDLPAGTMSPFMLFSVQCKKPELIPSAVHVDDSARLQTLDAETNGRFYDLVCRVHEKSGVPVVLNTSFNVQGEPIVESPDDAIRCFLGTEIDVLALEDFVLEKAAALKKA